MAANLAEDDTVGGYYVPLISLFDPTAHSSSDNVNIFAAIAGFTMPKSTRGTHKYSVSFALVDPTRSVLSGAVFLVWFCNSLDGINMNFKVGDMMRIEKAKVQEFNGFPQLVAMDHKSSISIFHRREDPIVGLPTMPLSPLQPHTAPPVDGSQILVSHNRSAFTDAAWATTVMGVNDTNNDRMSKAARKALPAPSVDRPPSMWPEEVQKLYTMHAWAQALFRTRSFADTEGGTAYNSTLHALQQFIHAYHHSTAYDVLGPQADPTRTEGAGARSTVAQTGKCDVVCLVTSVVPPERSADNRAKMTVWDGTTNGRYLVPATFRQAVQVALDAPAIYDSALVRPTNDAQLREQLMGLYQKDVPPRKLWGSGVLVEVMNEAFNAHISRCKPGMWIRIRNLYGLDGGGQAMMKPCTVRADSHICQLSPDFLDVRTVVQRYVQRAAKAFVQQVAANNLAPSAPGVAPAVPAVALPAPALAPVRPPPPPQPSTGEPLTPIALVRAGPAPARYCIKGKVEAWAPASLQEFVSVGAVAGRTLQAHLMFSLRVSDVSDYVDVLFEGRDAETFLGATAAELVSNAAARARAEDRLSTCRDLAALCEFKVEVYVDKETVALGGTTGTGPGSGASSKRGRGPGGGRKDAAEPTYIRKRKRVIAYDVLHPVLPAHV